MQQLDAPTLFFAIATSAYTGLSSLAPLVLPQVLRPGTAPLLVASAVAVLAVAVAAVRWSRRTGSAPAWWAWWSTLVMTFAGTVVLDPLVRQSVAMSLVVGPAYSAMFLPVRHVLVHTGVTGAAMVVLVAGIEGPWPVRVLRVACCLSVSGALVVGLVTLRSRLDRALAVADESSRRDPLTGLLNRRGLAEALPGLLDRAVARGCGVVVVVADLDRFKAVNDTFGHATGDAVLTAVARALPEVCRPGDLVGRLGGEELVLVCAVPRADVPALSERLRRHVQALDCAPPVTVSVGAAWAAVDPGWDGGAGGAGRPGAAADVFRELSHRADVLMYAAKAAGRNAVRVQV